MRAGRLVGLGVLLLLAAVAALSILVLRPPSPAPADAPADEFSAGRAFASVEQIAGGRHVTGSAADDRVRGYLVDTLTELGLQVRVQDDVGVHSGTRGGVVLARVRNVVAVLPGSAPTGRLFLVAHHDSVETGPGGSDDAAGLSTALETVRALVAGVRPRNDVVVLFTDAEEACRCGAEAFAADDPLAADGGVVLNLEARGTGGPPIMFETARGNAGLAGVYAAVAPHPVATSFAVEVYRALPNDTDFSPLLAGGFTGLNTAWIEGSAAYHTPEDTPGRMDRGALQALGDNTLALTRELGNRDLRPLSHPGDADAVYFPVLGLLVRYPGALVGWVAGLAAVAVGVLAAVARRRTGTSLRRSLAGFGLAVVPLVLAPLAAYGSWALLVAVRPGYAAMTDPWRPGWFRLGVIALVFAVVLTWYALLRRRLGPVALQVGALGWPVVLGIVLAVVAPGGSYLGAVPALAAAAAGTAGLLTGRTWVRVSAAVVAGGVGVLVLVPTIALFFPALGLAGGAAPALLAVLLALVLLPALDLLFTSPDRSRRWATAIVPLTAAALAVALVGTGLSVDRFDARHPVPTQLMYALDADRQRAWWVSNDDHPVDWTARYLDGREDLTGAFPLFPPAAGTGPARAADVPAPALTVDVRALGGGRRELTVHVSSQRAARLLVLDVAGARVTGAELAGRPVPPTALGGEGLTVTVHAAGPEGITGTLVVDGGPLTVRALDASDGLAQLPGFVPRPPGVGVAGTHTSDLLLVATTREV